MDQTKTYLENQDNKKHKTTRAKITKRKITHNEIKKKKREQRKNNFYVRKLFKVASKKEKRLINLKKLINEFEEKFPNEINDFTSIFRFLDQGNQVDTSDVANPDAKLILEQFFSLMDISCFGNIYCKNVNDGESTEEFVKKIINLTFNKLKEMIDNVSEDSAQEDEDIISNTDKEEDTLEGKEDKKQIAENENQKLGNTVEFSKNKDERFRFGIKKIEANFTNHRKEKKEALTWENAIDCVDGRRKKMLVGEIKDDIFERIEKERRYMMGDTNEKEDTKRIAKMKEVLNVPKDKKEPEVNSVEIIKPLIISDSTKIKVGKFYSSFI